MGKECKTCKFWDITFEGDGPPEKDYDYGQCLKALMYEYQETHGSPMMVADGSQYMAILMTKPDHYCKEYIRG